MSADRVAEAFDLLEGRERRARTSTGSYGLGPGATYPATVLRECAGWRAILALHPAAREPDLDLWWCEGCGNSGRRVATACPTVRAVCDALLGPEETA